MGTIIARTRVSLNLAAATYEMCAYFKKYKSGINNELRILKTVTLNPKEQKGNYSNYGYDYHPVVYF